MLYSLFLCIFVSSDKRLVLTSQKHDFLLVFHLSLDIFLIQAIDFLSLQVKIDTDEVYNLLNRIDLLIGLLGSDHLFKLAFQVSRWLELLDGNQTAQLLTQICDRLEMGDLPVEESIHICQICQFETEQFSIELEIILTFGILIIIQTLRDQHVLASVYHLIDLALDVTELVLLVIELIRLSK